MDNAIVLSERQLQKQHQFRMTRSLGKLQEAGWKLRQCPIHRPCDVTGNISKLKNLKRICMKHMTIPGSSNIKLTFLNSPEAPAVPAHTGEDKTKTKQWLST